MAPPFGFHTEKAVSYCNLYILYLDSKLVCSGVERGELIINTGKSQDFLARFRCGSQRRPPRPTLL